MVVCVCDAWLQFCCAELLWLRTLTAMHEKDNISRMISYVAFILPQHPPPTTQRPPIHIDPAVAPFVDTGLWVKAKVAHFGLKFV